MIPAFSFPRLFYNIAMLSQDQSFFFVGVAGSGMSAIAVYLAGRGFAVSGSDRKFSGADGDGIRAKLEAAGVRTFPQDGSGVCQGLSAIVVSTAIEESNPDLKRALELGIPRMHRSEMLAKISKSVKTICVSGTSGKSTVTGMIWHILNEANLSPSLLSGAGLVSLERRGMIGNGIAGKGEWLVAESDESDGTLVRYSPEIGVILNIGKDHKEISELQKIFAEFSKNVTGKGKTLIVNEADELANAFSVNHLDDFGLEAKAGVQGMDFSPEGYSIAFRVRHLGELVRFKVPLPGFHNMMNALAAVAVSLKVGVSLRKCAEALETFEGIHRRHQILGTFHGVTVVDDFAHNPAKIAASIRAAQDFTRGRVIAYFQPHGFGPTRFLRNELVDAISKALRPQDSIFLSEIYYAGGTVTRDISSADLVEDLKRKNATACFVSNRDECGREMVRFSTSGDTILIMGARDPSLSEFAKTVAKELEK